MSVLINIQRTIEQAVTSESNQSCTQFSVDPITAPQLRGEITTNAAMVLAKSLATPPRALAQLIKNKLEQTQFVEEVEVAGPGFVNIVLKKEAWARELRQIVALGEQYSAAPSTEAAPSPEAAQSTEAAPSTKATPSPKATQQTFCSGLAEAENEVRQPPPINVEFVSANPTGPMHAGHVRNAIFGDAIAALLEKTGHKVYREYYINDAGKQVEHLARSVFWRYGEALGQETIQQTAEMYPGDYLVPVGCEIAQQDGDKWVNSQEDEWLPVFKEKAVASMMALIKQDLAELGVYMDYYASEKALIAAGKVEEALQLLQWHNDVYRGVIDPPKGVVVDDWEERPQLLFRSTKYGDDIDRPLQKSDGSWTYFATDIAYHMDKMQRGFRTFINVLGADHCGYVKRITAATNAIAEALAAKEAVGGVASTPPLPAKISVKLFQIVNFFENGQPVKMSKRSGTFITSKDIVEKVGKNTTRFMMVSRHNGTVIDFDFQKVLECSQDNPIFYIQYAHSRICSVFSHVLEFFPHLTEEFVKQGNCNEAVDLASFSQEETLIIRRLVFWPRVVEQAAYFMEPHRISTFLYELSADFHRLWTLGKTNTILRFIHSDDQKTTEAKMVFLYAVAIVLRDGLGLLGVTPMYRM